MENYKNFLDELNELLQNYEIMIDGTLKLRSYEELTERFDNVSQSSNFQEVIVNGDRTTDSHGPFVKYTINCSHKA